MSIKNIKSFVVGAMVALACACFADSETVNGFTWHYRLTADGKGAELYFRSGYAAIDPVPDGAVVIPAKLGGKPVVAIGDSAFYSCQQMTEVTIPSTVTLIGNGAFIDCGALKHLTLPTGLKTIANSAFVNAGLKSLIVPDNVTEIEEYAFYGTPLEYIQIGKKVEAIGDYAFQDCFRLENIVFKGNAPTQISTARDDVFENVPVSCVVYVTKSAKGWPEGGMGLSPHWMGFEVKRDECKVEIVALASKGLLNGEGEVTGGGFSAIGKKVTFKAKPAAGSVFAGWAASDMVLGTQSFLGYGLSYGYTVTGETSVHFIGMFVSTANDEMQFRIPNRDDIVTEEDGSLDLPLRPEYVKTLSEPKITFKNLPAGIKYDAKTFKLVGKATKPGIYKVTVSATNASVKKAITAEWVITVPNFTDDLIAVDDRYGPYIPGVEYEEQITAAEGCTVTGLPAGMKWTAKVLATKDHFIADNSVYGAATKPGDYTVFFTKTVKEGNKSVKHTATATFTVGPLPKLTIETVGASGKDKVTGAGEYAANKKVSLKATPDTSKDNPKVFMGWYDESNNLLSQAATYSYVMPPEDKLLQAKFITQKEDSDNIFVGVGPLDYSDFDGNLEAVVFLPCGVNVLWPIMVDALSQTTVKVSGLPAGMKYTAKDVIDPKTKEVIAYANSIYGAPTAESKTKLEMGMTRKVPSDVKIEVTTSGKTKKTYVVKTYVEAMQPWAVGTFNGGTVAKDGDVYDLSAMTVATTGKISGKISGEDGSPWTFSAAAFEEYDPVEETYSALVDIKQGPASGPSWVTITRKDGLLAEVKFIAFNPADMLYNSPWKSDPWKTLAKKFTTAAAKTLVLNVADRDGNPGVLTLTFAATGAVTAKGVFTVGGKPYTASCSSVVTPTTDIGDPTDTFDAYLYLLLPYKDGKFAGYGARLELYWNGTNFEL